MSAGRLLDAGQKSRRKRYDACDDVVREAGLDLPCGAGHLGLQGAAGALLSALGFKSP